MHPEDNTPPPHLAAGLRASFRLFGTLPKARGVAVLVTADTYRGRLRVDVREWIEWTPGKPDTLQPTRKGANLTAQQLPALLAALRRAEAAAIEAGALKARDYHDAGLPLPAELQPASAASGERRPPLGRPGRTAAPRRGHR